MWYLGDYGEEGVADFMDFYSAAYVPRSEFSNDWFEGFTMVLLIDFFISLLTSIFRLLIGLRLILENLVVSLWIVSSLVL